ncbi:T9SS type A sorting domain-containing protein [Coprobacter sp.]|uniref:T9SS type A sorting domain-containing protein n=1 Tax=Coprobacter sp. TaxID=1941478 RepID=UPI003AB12BD4
MRKLYTVLIICLSGILFPFCSSAQDEVFPTKDAIWNIYIPKYGAMVTSHYYGFVGDTVFDGLSYRKLYLLKDSVLRENPENVYVGGVRVSGKKVYMRPTDTATGKLLEEFLMYDFSVKAGDEVFGGMRPMVWGCTFENLTGSDIKNTKLQVFDVRDSELGREFGVDLKFESSEGYCESEGSDTWIEGVGSLLGLFLPPSSIPTGKQKWIDMAYGQRSALMCLKVGDKIRYKDPGCEECMEVLNVSENVVIPVTVRQIGNRQLLIQCPVHNLPLQFELLNLSGTVLQQNAVRDGGMTIDLEVSVPGIYIYRIIGDKVYKSEKIVVR